MKKCYCIHRCCLIAFFGLIFAVSGCSRTEEAADTKMIRHAKLHREITVHALGDGTLVEAAAAVFDGLCAAVSDEQYKKISLKHKKKDFSAPFSDPNVRKLCDAICENDIEKMNRLIAGGIDVNSVGTLKKAVLDQKGGIMSKNQR